MVIAICRFFNRQKVSYARRAAMTFDDGPSKKTHVLPQNPSSTMLTFQQQLRRVLPVLSVARAFVIHQPALHSSRSFATSLDASATTKSTSSLYGGDFAGLSASFSATDGSLIPVPELYVPKALLEWDASPSAWEVIVSEHLNDESLTRQTVQVLPDVGCGIDNLETKKVEEVLEILSLRITDDDSIVSFDVALEEGKTRTETTFALPNGDGDDHQHRLRVVMDVVYEDNVGFAIQTPITVAMERQASKESTGGEIAKGGGLQGSKVSGMIGKSIRKEPIFCNQAPLEWQPPGVKVLNLPGNITIACSPDAQQSPWMLDIVHVATNSNGEGEKQVVRRSLHAPSEKQE
jgi:hypothetical protein